jgi:hypothetical protein
MAKQEHIWVENDFNIQGQTINNADNLTVKDLFVAGANGSVVKSISCVSTDTAVRYIKLYHYTNSVAYLRGTIPIPAGSGNAGSYPSINLLDPYWLPFLKLDNPQNRTWSLKAGDKIQISAVAQLTADKVITCVAEGGDF